MGLKLEIHPIRPGDALSADEYEHALETLKRVKALIEYTTLVRVVIVEDKRHDNHRGRPPSKKAA